MNWCLQLLIGLLAMTTVTSLKSAHQPDADITARCPQAPIQEGSNVTVSCLIGNDLRKKATSCILKNHTGENKTELVAIWNWENGTKSCRTDPKNNCSILTDDKVSTELAVVGIFDSGTFQCEIVGGPAAVSTCTVNNDDDDNTSGSPTPSDTLSSGKIALVVLVVVGVLAAVLLGLAWCYRRRLKAWLATLQSGQGGARQVKQDDEYQDFIFKSSV